MTNIPVVLTGLGLMAVAGAVVMWRGGPLERRVAVCGLVCWTGSAIGQVLTHVAAAPIIVADLVFAACLLFFVLRHHRGWLYGLVAIEAARLILHGLVYQGRLDPSPTYRLINNGLSTIGLLVLVAAALSRTPPAPAPASEA